MHGMIEQESSVIRTLYGLLLTDRPLRDARPMTTPRDVEAYERACDPKAMAQLANHDTVHCYVGNFA